MFSQEAILTMSTIHVYIHPSSFFSVIFQPFHFFRLGADVGNWGGGGVGLEFRKSSQLPCKRLSVNWMAAGSRLPRSSHGFFLLSPTAFQTHLL